MQTYLTALDHNLPNVTSWTEKILWDLFAAALIYLIAAIAIRIGTRTIRHFLGLRISMGERRRQTLVSLMTNILKYTVHFLMVLTILPLFGINIAAILAGAGVVGLAVGFGAQSLVKDFFTGFFILFEDQYRIGDWVVINGVTGKVSLVTPRITGIEAWTGETVFFPNGTISQVTNFSKSPSQAVISFNVGYDTDADYALKLLKNVLDEVQAEDPNALGEAKILGVNALNDSNYTIEATIKCQPYSQFSVQRLTYKKLQKHFFERGMKPPFQNVVMVHPEPDNPSK